MSETREPPEKLFGLKHLPLLCFYPTNSVKQREKVLNASQVNRVSLASIGEGCIGVKG